jgi:hypothetical protein
LDRLEPYPVLPSLQIVSLLKIAGKTEISNLNPVDLSTYDLQLDETKETMQISTRTVARLTMIFVILIVALVAMSAATFSGSYSLQKISGTPITSSATSTQSVNSSVTLGYPSHQNGSDGITTNVNRK